MDERGRRRRAAAKVFWRVVNPPTRLLAGRVPWWVLLETTGRRSGLPRRLPLATGPVDGAVMWLIATQGEHADFVRNIAARPRVRVRYRRRWRSGTAEVHPVDPDIVRRFNRYARSALGPLAIDPRLVKIVLDTAGAP